MWFLRAPVRITLLLQGPKLKPQGTATGMNMGNFWWAKNINDFLWFLRAPVRITLFPQGSKLGHQGTTKGMQMGNVWWVKKSINDFYMNFARACQDHIFAARAQVETPRDSQRNENWKCLMGKKNINYFYVNFACTCQDHTFAARIQIGTSRDSQRNENGKCLMGKKT